jgi:mercuric ion binding protein
MKTLKIVSLLSFLMSFSIFSFSQAKTETIPVSGNCGMCKTNIEKAAKSAGATTANWNKDKKIITIKYNSSTTNAAKIQQGIAAAGYDTRDFKASDAAYNKLHACCQYDRTASAAIKHQCGENCVMKDGKCADMAACKEKGCCKDSEDCKATGCCADVKTVSYSH